MKIEKFEIKAESLKSSSVSPWVTCLNYQQNGTLLCGLAFGSPSLLRLKRSENGALEAGDLELDLGSSSLGVWAGLRSTTSGATAMSVLHSGLAPGFVASLFSKGMNGKNLEDFLRTQDGGLGLWARHSVLMLSKDDLTLRHDKMPGALIDVALVGDYLFGLSGSELWREHYLKPEKRETLRSDLKDNSALHRSSDGTFWLQGQNDRLLRLSHTDIRAKPTPLKLPGGGTFHLSSSSSLDGWLYGTCNNSRTLFRVRVNPVSFEEELQKIADLQEPITALQVCEGDEKGLLIVAVKEGSGSVLMSAPLHKPEDAELIPAAPALSKLLPLPDLESVGSLTVEDAEKCVLWLAPGKSEGASSPARVLRISELL